MNENYRISHNKEKYTKPIYFHSHDFYEIYFFVDGNVKYYIENESYDLSKGDVLIIPPGKLHRPVIDGDQVYERYVLWISSRYAAANKGIGSFTDEII
ncbi:MAG: AraC family ligand binding domain-containing protein [Oscillospiraceae bacterium]|nr:AraC family ligand binding domain-containing protein [Oscillospiraceae bacterium]